jgi:general stress protein 26
MTHEAELVAKFWKALKSDRTAMIGLPDVDGGRSQPMTAQIEGDEGGPIWFFSSSETDLVGAVGAGAAADLHFVGKGHDLFATVSGRMTVNTDPAMVGRLWNPFVAAWYEGKDDPKLRLLCFEPGDAQIWLNENSLFAGLKMMLGGDPKSAYKDKVAQTRLA